MKVEVNEELVEEYPRLMISVDTGIIVWFPEYGVGCVVYSPEGYPFNEGYHSSSWDMERFRNFRGSVTLSND